jgi:predicted lipoprotein with Yx(FWY)xxD motif
MTFRPIYRVLAPLAALAAGLALTATAQAAGPAPTTGRAQATPGTEIIVTSTEFGPALAVGSGPFKNHTLYLLTSDNPPSYGCTTAVTKTVIGQFTCTGPSTSKAEWPAITTVGKPVAGPGVKAALLGTVDRPGVGDQVTYAGHPLYLFVFDSGSVSDLYGEGFNEPGVPPWHGVWWLVSPTGQPVPWAGTLTTTTTTGGEKVLAASYMTYVGWVNFPLYTFTGDKGGKPVCAETVACARAWPPMFTGGRPGAIGVPISDIGAITTSSHLIQVTWNGDPLYLFGNETLKLLADRRAAPVGNGNGITAFGGTFHLVVSP